MSLNAAHTTYRHLIKNSGIMPSNQAVWLAESGQNLWCQW